MDPEINSSPSDDTVSNIYIRGEIQPTQITDSFDFWCLYDEMDTAKSEYLKNRECILRAFKNGNLYGLRINETDLMYKKGVRDDPKFARQSNGELSMYLLPCFCVKGLSTEENTDNIAELLWAHTRVWHLKLCEKLLDLLGIKPSPEYAMTINRIKLGKFKVTELKKFAKNKGLKGYSALRKQELIEVLIHIVKESDFQY